MTAQDTVRAFVDAASDAYDAQVTDPKGRASIEVIFTSLQGPLPPRDRGGARLPACEYLDEVAQPARFDDEALREVVQAFRALEPHLTWYKRTGDAPNANAAYADGHANAMIIGPGGLVPHDSVWLGASLLAPGVRYPDHTHPPEETYLMLSEGEFYQEGRGWFAPGVGGTFYNRPGILHAMRSGDAPLFAIWALRAV